MNCQLVVMSLKPGEDIGEEVHQLDQLLCVVEAQTRRCLTEKNTGSSQGLRFSCPLAHAKTFSIAHRLGIFVLLNP